MKKSLFSLLLLALLVGAGLAACGKTGPLYLPDAQPQQPAQQDK